MTPLLWRALLRHPLRHPWQLVLAVLGIALINIEPPTVLFGLFVVYATSGYALYVWRKAKGQQVSMVSTSIDEPDEKGLHH